MKIPDWILYINYVCDIIQNNSLYHIILNAEQKKSIDFDKLFADDTNSAECVTISNNIKKLFELCRSYDKNYVNKYIDECRTVQIDKSIFEQLNNFNILKCTDNNSVIYYYTLPNQVPYYFGFSEFGDYCIKTNDNVIKSALLGESYQYDQNE
jgi:hypothetical protein